MRSVLSIVFVGLSGLALVACGSDGPGDPFNGTGGSAGSGGTVLDCSLSSAPPSCNDLCPTSDSECGAGTFCLNGVCSYQCTTELGCGAGSTCSVSGRCIPNSGTGGTGGTGNTGGSECGAATVCLSDVCTYL